jgi:thiamine-phosphate pyrophosphorylase
MNAIASCRLYGILDAGYVRPSEFATMAKDMVRGGIDVLQLRAKGASLAEVERWGREIHPITADAGVPLIINDHPEAAVSIEAEGVHVGQDDLPLSAVRKLVPEGALIGKSTHSLAQASEAVEEAPDYIGFGPLFATPTKPDYIPIGTEEITGVEQLVEFPVFCIGGIKKENLSSVVLSGAHRVVIVSGILQAEDVSAYIRECKRILSDRS